MSKHRHQHGRSRAIAFIVISLLMLLSTFFFFKNTPDVHQSNVCFIFSENPGWYRDAKRAAAKWGVPIATQMAIIHQESHFQAAAKPVKAKVFGVFAVHTTSAVGYSQALDDTWRLYLKETNQISADRESFAAASDFIGWFADRAHHQLGLSKKDTSSIYLAYHEGLAGYYNKSFKNKHWLRVVAYHVARQANRYQKQLTYCKGQLDIQQVNFLSAKPSRELLHS